MEPVALELCADFGVLEPFQTATTVSGQIEELAHVVREQASLPAMLIGHSWGAWLVYMLAARHPDIAGKLVLVGSGPFEECYAKGIMETRMKNLKEQDRLRLEKLLEALESSQAQDKNGLMEEFGSLMSKADSYDPMPEFEARTDCRFEVFDSVWPEAEKLRKSGELPRMGRQIACPVVAIHGSHDPHPAEGVKEPLSKVLQDFRFVLLDRCGHTPWVERFARERFFELLRIEVV